MFTHKCFDVHEVCQACREGVSNIELAGKVFRTCLECLVMSHQTEELDEDCSPLVCFACSPQRGRAAFPQEGATSSLPASKVGRR